MNTELSRLEVQITQLLALHEALKAQGRELHEEATRLAIENRVLHEKIQQATQRIAALVKTLPILEEEMADGSS